MIYGLWHSAAGMLTNEYRQDVTANNLANADTVGFKRDLTSFAERMPARLAGRRSGVSDESLDPLSGGTWPGHTVTSHEPGALIQTDQPLDVAIDGPGFLVVERNGRPQYTRDGRIVKDARGMLVAASDGAPLLGTGGTPVLVNPFGGQPQINSDGQVTQDGQVIAELALADFANYDALRKVGAARFDAGDQKPQPFSARLLQNHLEGSSVQPVHEMVDMIEASRAYQMNAQMLTLQDQTIGRLISLVARA